MKHLIEPRLCVTYLSKLTNTHNDDSQLIKKSCLIRYKTEESIRFL